MAHNGSSFDRYLVLNSLPHWRTILKIIKKCKGMVYLKQFFGYVNKGIPQYDNFKSDITNFKKRIKNTHHSWLTERVLETRKET